MVFKVRNWFTATWTTTPSADGRVLKHGSIATWLCAPFEGSLPTFEVSQIKLFTTGAPAIPQFVYIRCSSPAVVDVAVFSFNYWSLYLSTRQFFTSCFPGFENPPVRRLHGTKILYRTISFWISAKRMRYTLSGLPAKNGSGLWNAIVFMCGKYAST